MVRWLMPVALLVGLVPGSLAAGAAPPAAAQAKAAEAENAKKAERSKVPADVVAKITAAAPDKPTAAPKMSRKVLIISVTYGYRHDVIPTAGKALEILGSKTGAFEAVISDDLALFEPERLKAFDAVCLNNAVGEIFLPPDVGKLPPAEQKAARDRDGRLKQGLLSFVRDGKGLIALHAGMYVFLSWPEFAPMIGGHFDNHPWGAGDTVAVKVDEPDHVLCAAFKGARTFRITDETYQFKDPYSRARQRVLLSIDTSATDMTKSGVHRTDGDFGLSWIRAEGKGRVFYFAPGHNVGIWTNPMLLRHVLDGIQYALGDLDADAAPKGKAGGRE